MEAQQQREGRGEGKGALAKAGLDTGAHGTTASAGAGTAPSTPKLTKPLLGFSEEFKSRWARERGREQRTGDVRAGERGKRHRMQMHLSVSNDGDYCLAQVSAELVEVTEGEEDRIERALETMTF